MACVGERFPWLRAPRPATRRLTIAAALTIAQAVWSWTGVVYAHAAPTVVSILDEDADGVHLVRLLQGIALREGDTWRFVCSQTYGGKGQDIAASLPGGGAVVAVPTGIALLKRDGSTTPHPDPEAAQGTPTAFARADGKLYALRMRPRLRVTDVVEITDTTVRIVWTDSRYWSDLAVADSALVLVRTEGDEVDELRLSFSGEVVSEQKASLVDPLEVSVRVIGDTPYYTAKFASSTELARIEQNTWKRILQAGNTLAGPLQMPDGTVLVALDGVLSSLVNEVATPLSKDDFVVGLAQLDGHPYAATRTGMRELASTGLGGEIFDLAELWGPDECLVPKGSESDCELEWQHFQVELLGANIPLASGDTTQKQCGARGVAIAMGAAGASPEGRSAPNGGAGVTGGVPERSANATAGAAADAVATPTRSGSNCACGIMPQTPRYAANLGCSALLALAFVLRAARRGRARRAGQFRC
jgi:hypothetical protein